MGEVVEFKPRESGEGGEGEYRSAEDDPTLPLAPDPLDNLYAVVLTGTDTTTHRSAIRARSNNLAIARFLLEDPKHANWTKHHEIVRIEVFWLHDLSLMEGIGLD